MVSETSRTIVFYLVDNFSMIAFTTAIEPLRIANRLLGRTAYRWRIASIDGGPARASNGVALIVDEALREEQRLILSGDKPDFFFVIAGLGVEERDTRLLRTVLRQAHQRGVQVGGLCTAAWILAEAGLLDGRRCAIHWENLPAFQEQFPEADVYADLFEEDGSVRTCAGGTASLDMMLHVIDEDFDEALITQICEQCLTDRVRGPHDRQRLPLRARLGVHNSKLLSVIEMMEANIGEPLDMDTIARQAGLSRRQIERLFLHHLGRSPARYYLEIRLERARHLLIQSAMPVIEVAVACGFVSASHFSRCYREMYGRSPQTERQNRTALQAQLVPSA